MFQVNLLRLRTSHINGSLRRSHVREDTLWNDRLGCTDGSVGLSASVAGPICHQSLVGRLLFLVSQQWEARERAQHIPFPSVMDAIQLPPPPKLVNKCSLSWFASDNTSPTESGKKYTRLGRSSLNPLAGMKLCTISVLALRGRLEMGKIRSWLASSSPQPLVNYVI